MYLHVLIEAHVYKDTSLLIERKDLIPPGSGSLALLFLKAFILLSTPLILHIFQYRHSGL